MKNKKTIGGRDSVYIRPLTRFPDQECKQCAKALYVLMRTLNNGEKKEDCWRPRQCIHLSVDSGRCSNDYRKRRRLRSRKLMRVKILQACHRRVWLDVL